MQITNSFPTMSTMMPGGLRRRGGQGYNRMERTNPESGLSMRGLGGLGEFDSRNLWSVARIAVPAAIAGGLLGFFLARRRR